MEIYFLDIMRPICCILCLNIFFKIEKGRKNEFFLLCSLDFYLVLRKTKQRWEWSVLIWGRRDYRSWMWSENQWRNVIYKEPWRVRISSPVGTSAVIYCMMHTFVFLENRNQCLAQLTWWHSPSNGLRSQIYFISLLLCFKNIISFHKFSLENTINVVVKSQFNKYLKSLNKNH